MEALAIAQAVTTAIAVGALLSFIQERFLGRILDGAGAMLFNVAASLVIGAAAVAHVGGFVIGPAVGGDPFSIAQAVLATAILVAAASKAAFEVLTKPIAERR